MRTHSLAKALRQLAKVLRAGPNVQVRDLGEEIRWKGQQLHPDEIEVSVAQLAALSKVGKQDWEELIERHGFPISIKPRDGSRNIVGKLMSYLDNNPEALDDLSRNTSTSESEKSSSSPELTKALGLLLNKE